MTRIAIAGNSGSGKSTLARRLSADVDAPVLDLDTVAWEPGKIAVARAIAEATADVRVFCDSSEHWIVEGCYSTLVEAALPWHPHLLILDPGLDQCVSNCRSRPWEPHKYPAAEEQNKHLAFLLTWVEEYYSRNDDMSLEAHKALYEQYNGTKQWLSASTDPVHLGVAAR